jgi:hypothetical protein
LILEGRASFIFAFSSILSSVSLFSAATTLLVLHLLVLFFDVMLILVFQHRPLVVRTSQLDLSFLSSVIKTVLFLFGVKVIVKWYR